MMKMRYIIKGTEERGVACYLIHLRRHFKATRISGHEQERCNENSIILNVVVLGSCDSGKYCKARKIDKTLAWMIGDKGINSRRLSPHWYVGAPGILDGSIEQLPDLLRPES